MDINIRFSTKDDIPFLEKLMEDYLDYNLSPLRRYSPEEVETFRSEFSRDLRKRLEEKTLLAFIAEDLSGSLPLGFCLVEDKVDPVTGQKEVYYTNISVVKEAMGKRVSNRLAERVEDYARERGVFVVSGDITVSNRRSMMFAMRYFKHKPEKVTLLKYLK